MSFVRSHPFLFFVLSLPFVVLAEHFLWWYVASGIAFSKLDEVGISSPDKNMKVERILLNWQHFDPDICNPNALPFECFTADMIDNFSEVYAWRKYRLAGKRQHQLVQIYNQCPTSKLDDCEDWRGYSVINENRLAKSDLEPKYETNCDSYKILIYNAKRCHSNLILNKKEYFEGYSISMEMPFTTPDIFSQANRANFIIMGGVRYSFLEERYLISKRSGIFDY